MMVKPQGGLSDQIFFKLYFFFAFLMIVLKILKILRGKEGFEKEPKGGICQNFKRMTDNFYEKHEKSCDFD